MRKLLSLVAGALLAVTGLARATPSATNVLQNVNIQLTIYQQGAASASGAKVSDIVTSFTTKSLIADIGAIAGGDFGTGAKLVQSTVYSNVVIPIGTPTYTTALSTNLALSATGYLTVGGTPIYGAAYGGDVGIAMVTNNQLLTYGGITSDLVSAATSNGTITATVTINTNEGFLTTLTPETNTAGSVTNVLVLSQQVFQLSTNVLTNVSTSLDVLYGTAAAPLLYPVTNLIISANSPQIVVETGGGLNTTNGYITSQSAYSISNLVVDFTENGPTNLYITMEGFVKQALKIDTLSSHAGNKVVEDLYDGSSTWNLIGSGFAGGTYSTNTNGIYIQSLGQSLDGGSPVVAEGSLTISFLKNLPQ